MAVDEKDFTGTDYIWSAARQLEKSATKGGKCKTGKFPVNVPLEKVAETSLQELGHVAGSYIHDDILKLLWRLTEQIWSDCFEVASEVNRQKARFVLGACSLLAIPDYDHDLLENHFRERDNFDRFARAVRIKKGVDSAGRILIASSGSVQLRKTIAGCHIAGKIVSYGEFSRENSESLSFASEIKPKVKSWEQIWLYACYFLCEELINRLLNDTDKVHEIFTDVKNEKVSIAIDVKSESTETAAEEATSNETSPHSAIEADCFIRITEDYLEGVRNNLDETLLLDENEIFQKLDEFVFFVLTDKIKETEHLSIEDAMCDTKKVYFLNGVGGTGKTTALVYNALEFYKQGKPTYILDFVSRNNCLARYDFSRFSDAQTSYLFIDSPSKYQDEQFNEFVAQCMKRNIILILCDRAEQKRNFWDYWRDNQKIYKQLKSATINPSQSRLARYVLRRTQESSSLDSKLLDKAYAATTSKKVNKNFSAVELYYLCLVEYNNLARQSRDCNIEGATFPREYKFDWDVFKKVTGLDSFPYICAMALARVPITLDWLARMESIPYAKLESIFISAHLPIIFDAEDHTLSLRHDVVADLYFKYENRHKNRRNVSLYINKALEYADVSDLEKFLRGFLTYKNWERGTDRSRRIEVRETVKNVLELETMKQSQYFEFYLTYYDLYNERYENGFTQEYVELFARLTRCNHPSIRQFFYVAGELHAMVSDINDETNANFKLFKETVSSKSLLIDPRAISKFADFLIRDSRPGLATKLNKLVVEMDVEDVLSAITVAEWLKKANDIQGAIYYLNIAEGRDPSRYDKIRIYNLRGTIYSEPEHVCMLGLSEKAALGLAEENFNKSLELDNANPATVRLFCMFLDRQGKFSQAIQMLEDLIASIEPESVLKGSSLDTEAAGLRVRLGQLYANPRRNNAAFNVKKAKENYETAITVELKPSSTTVLVSAYASYARLLYMVGDLEKAERFGNQAVLLEEKLPRAGREHNVFLKQILKYISYESWLTTIEQSENCLSYCDAETIIRNSDYQNEGLKNLIIFFYKELLNKHADVKELKRLWKLFNSSYQGQESIGMLRAGQKLAERTRDDLLYKRLCLRILNNVRDDARRSKKARKNFFRHK